jgi:hypothetical protein
MAGTPTWVACTASRAAAAANILDLRPAIAKLTDRRCGSFRDLANGRGVARRLWSSATVRSMPRPASEALVASATVDPVTAA